MSETVTKNVFYKLQYDVITYSPTGLPVQVCYHGPTTQGFSSVETAKSVIEKLEQGNVLANKHHIYDILPVMVAEDFGEAPELTFSMEDAVDEALNLLTEDESPEEPQKSN